MFDDILQPLVDVNSGWGEVREPGIELLKQVQIPHDGGWPCPRFVNQVTKLGKERAIPFLERSAN